MQTPFSNDDNVERLLLAHPAIFDNRAPTWSDLPNGWYALVDALCSRIECEIDAELVRRINVMQIKEKFGTLRFYARLDGSGDVHLDMFADGRVERSIVQPEDTPQEEKAVSIARERLCELVDGACEASARTCDVCGAPGSLRQLSWLRTLCDRHFAARIALGR